MGTQKENVLSCPCLSDFHFKRKCPIKTCQHYTEQTKHRCLAIDRQAGADKSFTDKELAYFKFGNLINIREVSTKRRAGLSSIKNITALFLFVQYIDANCDSRRLRKVYVGEELQDLIGQSHLRHKQVAFKTWMLRYILDQQLFKRFSERAGVSSDVTFKSMLGLTTSDYKSFSTKVSELIKQT